MSKRFFDTRFWMLPFPLGVSGLPKDCAYLYMYLLYNNFAQPSGIYYIQITSIAHELGLTPKNILKMLKTFEPYVKYDEESSYIYVQKFLLLHRNSKTFERSAVLKLAETPHKEFIEQFCKDYQEVAIDYRETIDSLSVDYVFPYTKLYSSFLEEKNKEKKEKDKKRKGKYGKYKNVFLSISEYEKLKKEISDLDVLIEDMSEGIQMKGYKYKDFNLALRKWNNNRSNKGEILL